MKNKLLLIFLTDLIKELDNKSKEVYSALEIFLEEPSHSFGFKLFSELSSKIISELDKIHNNQDFDYYYYERFQRDNILDVIEENSKENHEEKYLKLIFDISKELYKQDTIIGKKFSMFLTDHQEDNALQSFYPIDCLIKFIEDELDKKVYKEINTEDGVLVEEGWFYWFFFGNEFGSKELEYKDKKIKTYDDMIWLLKEESS